MELKSASSAKIGKRFCRKREELGYSIEQISEKIFINKKYLISIEKGDYNIFPSEVFAKAYFKKYSDYLNLSIDFPNLYNASNILKVNIDKPMKNFFTKKIFIRIFIIFILFALIMYFLLKPSSNVEGISKKIITNEQIAFDYEADSIVNSINVNSEIYTNQINEENILKLEFVDECWIEIHFRDGEILAQAFKKGDIYTKETEMPLKIVLSNADSVKGAYNGTEIDFMFDVNKINGVSTKILSNEQLD
tara:strand:+ start:5974 stop:6720 length:747 start_codon:yes stop_codon:yes gene_type:complete